MKSPFDLQGLRVMPYKVIESALYFPIRNVEAAVEPYNVKASGTKQAAQKLATALAAVTQFSEPVQQLYWLAYLLENMMPRSDEREDGLNRFFCANASDLAPRILHALQGSGFVDEAKVFAKAMGLFGLSWPNYDERKKHLSYGMDGWNPNPFDLALLTLGKQFGSKKALIAKVEKWVLATPELLAWLNLHADKFDDEERFFVLIYYLRDHWVPVNIGQEIVSGLPQDLQDLCLADTLASDISNGGEHQYFFNHSHLAVATVAALRRLGLEQQAEAVQRGLDMFPKPYPVGRMKWREAMQILAEASPEVRESWHQWDENLSRIGVDDEAIPLHLVRYAKAHNLLPGFSWRQ